MKPTWLLMTTWIGAAGAVAAQLRQVQRLGDHALAGERRVAVQEQGQDGVRLAGEVEPVLLRPHDALEHRVDGLEVGRVRREVDLGGRALLGGELALGAEVVLDVAGPLDRLRVLLALELAEDLAVGLAGDVGQHVEPAAVRHPDADLVHPVVRGAAHDPVEQRDDRLAALQREPLLPDELGLQERLERLGGVELAQDPHLLVTGRDAHTGPRPWPGSRRAGRGPGCACTRCRPCGSTSRAGCRGCGAA